MEDYEEDVGETPKRYDDSHRMATARTPNDYNRGVQNATEAGVADNRRVLQEMQEVRVVQRRELAELISREFASLVPTLAQGKAGRGEDAFDHVISVLRSAIQDDKHEIRELRERVADAQRAGRRGGAGVDQPHQGEVEALRDRIAEDESMIRYLQDCRDREAQVIIEWKKDVLLWLKHHDDTAQSHSSVEGSYREKHHRASRRPSPAPPREYYDDEGSRYESDYVAYPSSRPPRGRLAAVMPPSSLAWRSQEEKLLDILEQGERMYDRIMETTSMIKRKLSSARDY